MSGGLRRIIEMSVTLELIEQEQQQVQAGRLRDVHLHKEGTFLPAYDWSAFLCCRYLHDFKVNKRVFKGIDEPVAYIGFIPLTESQPGLRKRIGKGVEAEIDSFDGSSVTSSVWVLSRQTL